MFSLGAVLLLLFSVCVLGLCAYSIILIVRGHQAPISNVELAIAPFLGLSVFLSSIYILMGKPAWLFHVSFGLLLLFMCGAVALVVGEMAGLSTPWQGDGFNMGLGIGGYCSFLLVGICLKRFIFGHGLDKQ